MIRTIFLLLILAHALIHLLGFVKDLNIASIPQLTGKTIIPISGATPKVMGVLWLLAFALLAVAGTLFLFYNKAWWMWGIAGVVLSQLLVIMYWTDAKAGTLPNLIMLPAILVAWGGWNFDRMAGAETQALLAGAIPEKREVVAPAMLEPLPGAVRLWLEKSGVVGKEKIYTVRLQQKGLLRRTPEENWMKTKATQFFTTEKPGFTWNADVRMSPILSFSGLDKYRDGEGNMLIKALSLLPVVDASGPELDQGTLLRYLGEICWFPSAALCPYISWEAVDDHSARATMNYEGVSASGVFTFDESGRMLSFSAQRYLGAGEEAKLENWHIPAREWKEFDGVRVPSKGDVIWQLEDGDFNYYQWEVEDVKYNVRN
jgi:hypothetical protein